MYFATFLMGFLMLYAVFKNFEKIWQWFWKIGRTMKKDHFQMANSIDKRSWRPFPIWAQVSPDLTPYDQLKREQFYYLIVWIEDHIDWSISA